MFLMEGLSERIKNILQLKNISRKKASAILGFKMTDLTKYSNGTRPNIVFLFALVEYFHVRPDYIITGREPIFMSTDEIKDLNIEQSFL